jgi:hypothetical protein
MAADLNGPRGIPTKELVNFVKDSPFGGRV